MADPVAGLREMTRVTRPGGLVAACVWDHAGGGGPLASFWQAVHDLDPQATGESGLAGARAGHLTELCEAAGLTAVDGVVADDPVPFATFDDWWRAVHAGRRTGRRYVTRTGRRRPRRLRSRCARGAAAGAVRDRRLGVDRDCRTAAADRQRASRSRA